MVDRPAVHTMTARIQCDTNKFRAQNQHWSDWRGSQKKRRGRASPLPDSIEGNQVCCDAKELDCYFAGSKPSTPGLARMDRNLKQVRVIGNIGNRIRVLLLEDLPRCAPIQWVAPFQTREPTSISTDVYGSDGHRWKERNMRASDTLFCFASSKIEIHPCPNCRAPMLARISSAGLDTNERTFECFNCDTVMVVPGDPSELTL